MRLAVVVGNDLGFSGHAALRFAEDDARKMRAALVEVGGFSAADVTLLVGEGEGALTKAFSEVRRRVDTAGGDRVLVLFYFSGHSDGLSIEVGEDIVPFTKVRKLLDETGATLRIAIVDACLSGQMIGLKGVRPAPEFDIDVAGDLNAEGSVVLTSSSADEMAQENAQLGGAVFTHHLVSGMYGAADEDGDLRISLRELYRYTYGRTVGATAQTVAGPQHPSYGFELEGKGDVILAMVSGKAAVLEFPASFDGDFFVLSEPSRSVVAQVTQDGTQQRRLYLAPGVYSVLRRAGESLSISKAVLRRGNTTVLAATGFDPAPATLAEVRYGGARTELGVLGYYALSGWLMPEMGALHSAGVMLRQKMRPLDVQLRFSYGVTSVNDDGFTYDVQGMDAAVAPLLSIPFHRFDLLMGPVLGAARLQQESAMTEDKTAWSVVPGLLLGAEIRPFEDMLVFVGWEFDLYLVPVNGELTARPAPRATLGVGYAL